MSNLARSVTRIRAATFATVIAAITVVTRNAAAADDQWHVRVGPGLVIAPEYPGSKDQEVLPIPALDVRYRSFFLDWRRGLGGYVVNDEHRQLGMSVWMRRGRDGDADSAVAALDDIDDSAVAQIFFSRSFGRLLLGATLAQAITGNTGLTAEASAEWQVQFSRATRASFGAKATFGNDRYMHAWFGVTPRQSQLSGLQPFAADGGLRSVGGFASLSYAASPRWTLAAFAGLDVLVGDAADSPIAERTELPTVGLGAFYRFGP
jgi:outer membrane protein